MLLYLIVRGFFSFLGFMVTVALLLVALIVAVLVYVGLLLAEQVRRA